MPLVLTVLRVHGGLKGHRVLRVRGGYLVPLVRKAHRVRGGMKEHKVHRVLVESRVHRGLWVEVVLKVGKEPKVLADL